MAFEPYELSEHESSKVELYLFETQDGLHKWAYSSDARSYIVNVDTYEPEAISRSALKQGTGESSSEKLIITVPFDNPVVLLHVPYLPPRPIKVTIFQYQRRDLSVEIKKSFIGFITSFSQKGPTVDFTCAQINDSMMQSVPWAVFKQGCIWATYEAGCGVDRINFMTLVNDLTSVNGEDLTAPSIGTKPDGWFRAGYAENEENGEVRFITSHVGNLVRLVYPFIGITTSTVLKLYAGDDRQPETCRLKFNNKINYVGFDHSPTINVFAKGTE